MADIDQTELDQLRKDAEAGKAASAENATLKDQLAANDKLVDATRQALIDNARAANPTIPPDMINGATPEEVTAAVERGKAAVDHVQRNTAAKQGTENADKPPAAPPVAGSAPPRTEEPPAGLRATARIRAGLAKLKEGS